mgnify:CR=1 FL=1
MRSVPLSMIPKGSKAVVVSILGGRGLMSRLMQMGLTPGTEVEVIENRAGPILIRVRGTVIALGRGVASKIIVSPLYR